MTRNTFTFCLLLLFLTASFGCSRVEMQWSREMDDFDDELIPVGPNIEIVLNPWQVIDKVTAKFEKKKLRDEALAKKELEKQERLLALKNAKDKKNTTPIPFTTDRTILRSPGKIARHKIKELDNVYFDEYSVEIKPEMRPALIKASGYFTKRPHLIVQIQGHCDTVGSTKYNYSLGQSRAVRVREFLIDRGVNPAQLYTISYGEQEPLELNPPVEGSAKNRRVEFYSYD